jgi:hypothetical protein
MQIASFYALQELIAYVFPKYIFSLNSSSKKTSAQPCMTWPHIGLPDGLTKAARSEWLSERPLSTPMARCSLWRRKKLAWRSKPAHSSDQLPSRWDKARYQIISRTLSPTDTPMLSGCAFQGMSSTLPIVWRASMAVWASAARSSG